MPELRRACDLGVRGSESDRERSAGVTIVELIMVVIILTLLAAIVVPQLGTSTQDVKEAALDRSLGTMRDLLELYFAQHGEYPAALPDGKSKAKEKKTFISQLARFTDEDGSSQDTKDAAHSYGPYLRTPQVPIEPMTGSRKIKIVGTGSLNLKADTKSPGGWKYDTVSGKFIVNHADWEDR